MFICQFCFATVKVLLKKVTYLPFTLVNRHFITRIHLYHDRQLASLPRTNSETDLSWEHSVSRGECGGGRQREWRVVNNQSEMMSSQSPALQGYLMTLRSVANIICCMQGHR